MATSDENTKRLEEKIDRLSDKVEERFDKIYEKLDTVDKRLGAIDTTLAAQHVSLAEHIRRTEILEDEIKPLKAQSSEKNGIIKFLKVLAILATIVEACHIVKLF